MIGATGSASAGGNIQVWVATTPVDMRKSFDGLAEVVRAFLGHDPLCGSMFDFPQPLRRAGEDLVVGSRRVGHLLQAPGARDVRVSRRHGRGKVAGHLQRRAGEAAERLRDRTPLTPAKTLSENPAIFLIFLSRWHRGLATKRASWTTVPFSTFLMIPCCSSD